MNLFETLHQFKKIEPDPAVKETSKRAILATLPLEPARKSVRQILMAAIETGLALGLAGFFILLATGHSFPGSTNAPLVSPAQFSVINPSTLRAEAQAVDIQINLAQLSYAESTTPALPVLKAAPAVSAALGIATSTPATAPTAAATSTPSSTVSVDAALGELAQ